MKELKPLTGEEINVLESHSCWAEGWSSVMIAERFSPKYLSHVLLHGENHLDAFEEMLEVTRGFFRHSGTTNATSRNVTAGDNNLIENIGDYTNNYAIGGSCFISNICTLETTEGAAYGEGNITSILNEVGDGNVVLFRELSNQLVVFTVQHFQDKAPKDAILRLTKESMTLNGSDQARIGNHVKIVNTKEITDTVVFDGCEISDTSRLSDCAVLSSEAASIYIGMGIICENPIISHESSIINSVKMQDYFVGETCQITNGLTASSSISFINSYVVDGRACAIFCGPFLSSHHRSSLLIGGMFFFYNASSATDFSNHAHKIGPMHCGVLQRGCKMASGAYLLMPANIGTFSVCFGRLMCHPDMRNLPFSYPIAYGDITYSSPGRNITAVGLHRDINKWPERDLRPQHSQKNVINFDWLSPLSVGEIVEGKKIPEKLRKTSGDDVSTYNYHEYVINTSSLEKGIKYYDIAFHTYMGTVLKRALKKDPALAPPITAIGTGRWTNLAGLLLPASEGERLIDDIKNGGPETIDDVLQRFADINKHYREYQRAWIYELIKNYYQLDIITLADTDHIHIDYIKTRQAWIVEIRKDAEKGFTMGNVEQNLFDDFTGKLDREGEHED